MSDVHRSASQAASSRPSVTITPSSGSGSGPSSVSQRRAAAEEDQQTPAQRQAAAKLALRKQLEKTLLQIPPPKPPPPEMHFVPNAANMEFIYLVGLECAVNYLLKDPNPFFALPQKTSPAEGFRCSQCNTDFTPVWKWDKSKKGKDGSSGKRQVICELCVTTNVKKGLKAQHTNRFESSQSSMIVFHLFLIDLFGVARCITF